MSKTPESPRPKPRRRPRRIAAVILVAIVVLLGTVAAGLPWLIGTSPVRRAVLAQVNRKYAPTRIELDHVDASWTGPTRLRGVVLRDGDGKAVVSSPTATLDRSLWQLLTLRPDYGTLTLHGAFVDIERHPDGSIDLFEALDPILSGDDDEPEDDRRPSSRFTLAVDAGTLLLTSPELAEPITTDRLDMTLHCTPAPMRWEIALEDPESRTLNVSGHHDTRDPGAIETVVRIEGQRWPMAVTRAGIVAEGIFDGSVSVSRAAGSISLSGDAVVTEVLAGGPALNGDRPRFDRVEAAWDLDLADDGLEIRRLDLDAPMATVGLAPDAPADASRWVGRVDLAALSTQLPKTIPLRDGLSLDRGTADFEATIAPASDGTATQVAVIARVADLAARDGERLVAMAEPVTLSARALQGTGSGVLVESASVDSAFLKAEGSGDLDLGVTINGEVDLGALDEQLRAWVDLGAVVFSGSGRFGGDYKRGDDGSTFTTRLAIEGRDLFVSGLTTDPITRDSARLDLIVQGPAAPPGLPAGWSTVHLASKTEGVDAVVDVTPIEDALGLRGRLAILAEPSDDEPVPGEPITILFDSSYRSADDRLDLAELIVEHDYGRVRTSGRIEGVSAARVADLTGAVDPDWEAISALVAEATEPRAKLAGTPRIFRLSGPLSGGSTREILESVDAELGIDLTEAVVFGLEVGPTPLFARLEDGEVLIAPIDSTISGGRVVLKPGLDLVEDGSMLLTLDEGSGFDQVEITDSVSRRVLAYIAPVLRDATQVNGRLSARIHRLSLPLAGPPPEQGGAMTDMEAQVAFQQVTYGPGPMMQNILGLAGLPPQQVPHLTINQLVDVAIRESRVHQSGLEIVASEGITFQLEGSVGLDQTLAIRAGVPLSDRLLGGQEVLADVLGGTRIGLPIGGTLSQPQLDREAFQVGLRQQGGRLLSRGAAAGAGQLLRLLNEGDAPANPEAGSGDPAPDSPPAEQLLRGLGRGLLRDMIEGPERPHAGEGRP